MTAEDEDAEETVTADDKEPGAEAAEDEEEGIVQEAEVSIIRLWGFDPRN